MQALGSVADEGAPSTSMGADDPRASKGRSKGPRSGTARSDSSGAEKGANMVNEYACFIGRTCSGVIVMIKDSFGFIKSVEENMSQQLFFHVSEVVNAKAAPDGSRPDLRRMFKPGDEVQFVVDPSKYNDGRLHAKQVTKLKPGSLTLLEIDPERRRGVAEVTKSGALVVAFTRDVNGQQVTRQLAFSAKSDVLSGSERVEAGDVVEFCLALDRVSNAQRAVEVEVIAKACTELMLAGQCLGHVIKLSEEGGELRRVDTGEEVPFGRDDVDRDGGLHKLTLKCEVCFTLLEEPSAVEGEGKTRWRAINVRLLPSGMITEHALGRRRGRIAAMPSSDKPGVADGVVECAVDGAQVTCSFGVPDVDDFMSSLHVGDEVEFDMVKNKFVDRRCARNVILLLQAQQGAEVGQVSVLKKNFGFIKCCTRIADMFFHVNALQPDSPPLEVGADVQFVPVLDPNTDKLIASELRVLPPGSAVFDTTSELEYPGVVRMACQPAEGAIPPVKGVIVGTVEGRTETLPFGGEDVVGGGALAVNDRVLFRLIEDRRISTMMKKASKMTRVTKAGGKRAGFVRRQPDAASSTQPPPSQARPIPTAPVSAALLTAALLAEGAAGSPSMQAGLLGEGRGGRQRGKVKRLSKKKVNGKAPCGFLRPVDTGNWSARKPRRSTADAVGTPPAANGLHEQPAAGRADEVVFYLGDLAPDVREQLRVNDEVEYTLVPDESEPRAVDLVLLRPHKPHKPLSGTASPLFHPPPAAAPAERPSALKFTGGSGAVNAKGPDGTRGFAAGRGRPLPDLKLGRTLSTTFKLASAIDAADFVPKNSEQENLMQAGAFEDAPQPDRHEDGQ